VSPTSAVVIITCRRGLEPRLVVVPVHGGRDLPLGTLRSILRQADLAAEELTELL